MSGRLYSVETGTSAQTVAKLLRVLYPDAATALDMTWGRGKFWPARPEVAVVGLDRSPHGRPSVLGDFTQLPFRDGAFDVCVFDPPYLSDVSKLRPGIVGRRFGSYASVEDVRLAVMRGTAEAWRVARLGIIVKVQTYTHASLLVDMPAWVRQALFHQPLYGRVEQVRPVKLRDPKWTDQLSVWSNSATFLAFRHGDQRHVRRRRAAQAPLFDGRAV